MVNEPLRKASQGAATQQPGDPGAPAAGTGDSGLLPLCIPPREKASIEVSGVWEDSACSLLHGPSFMMIDRPWPCHTAPSPLAGFLPAPPMVQGPSLVLPQRCREHHGSEQEAGEPDQAGSEPGEGILPASTSHGARFSPEHIPRAGTKQPRAWLQEQDWLLLGARQQQAQLHIWLLIIFPVLGY